MATYTEVANSNLCPGVRNDQVKTYLDFVAEFAQKYGNDPTRITIPSEAAKWEGHVAVGSTRLDLQGADNGYGNLQAQFGTGHGNCKKGGSYGGVLLLCNTPFTVEEVTEGLRRSLKSGGKFLVQLTLEAPTEAAEAAPDRRMKTKPGKKAWTPGTQYW